MPWTPTYNVIDVSPIAANLLTYFAANQTDALNWANGGAGLADFVQFYSSASGRLANRFPVLMILSKDEAEEPEEGDIIEAPFSLTFEGMLQGGVPDTLVTNAPKYARAVKSMLANIPKATLTAGITKHTVPNPPVLSTEYDVLASTGAAGAYLQTFRIRAQYILRTVY